MKIEANSALEGTNEDLIYRVEFDKEHSSALTYQFSIGGDATFGLDYQTGGNVDLTNGVINNGNGSITVPAGIQSFEAYVPVIDDNIIEPTEIASIQIGNSQGIGQIYDNDSFLARPKPEPEPTPEPNLELTDNQEGITVKGPQGTGLWIQLEVEEARDIWQNNFILTNSKGKALGTLGSTPEPHRYPKKGFKGGKHIYLEAGSSIYFNQQSNNLKIQKSPLLQLNKTETGSFVIAMEDGRSGSADFNDLVVSASIISTPESSNAVRTASAQVKTFHGLLDLNWLNSEQTLTLTTLKNTDPNNQVGLVKVDGNRSQGYTVDGISPTNSDAFRQALRDNIINPSHKTQEDWHITQSWTVAPKHAGFYAPVLITDDDLVFSFGRRTGADGQQHLKVLGENVFGFEDDLAGKRSDWHYDDVLVAVTLS